MEELPHSSRDFMLSNKTKQHLNDSKTKLLMPINSENCAITEINQQEEDNNLKDNVQSCSMQSTVNFPEKHDISRNMTSKFIYNAALHNIRL